MPFSADNPNRNRNFVILVIALVTAFAFVMAGYVALAIAGEDTDAFIRFLTIVFVTLIPSALAAFRANTAATSAQKTEDKVSTVANQVSAVQEKLNGTLDDRIKDSTKQAIQETRDEDGRPSV